MKTNGEHAGGQGQTKNCLPEDCIMFDRAHFRDIFPAFSRD